MKTPISALAFGSALTLALGLAAPIFAADKTAKAMDYTQSAFVAVTVNAEIPADRAKVWSQVIRKDVLVKMLGMVEATGSESMGGTGSSLCGSLGGESGNLVVTHAMIENEIRYAWEPEHGGYVCHIVLKLAPSGKGTRITLMDSYSDEKPGMIEKNAKDSRMHLSQSLEALKKSIVM